jgi:heterotetrameric sarcosine oxidase gamma subunit
MPRAPAKIASKPVEKVFPRLSPLIETAKQGRFGADRGEVGVTLTVRHPLSIVTVIARRDKAKAVEEMLAVLKGCTVQWAGPDQYYVIAESRGEGALYRELKEKLEGLASVTDQSHGRVVIRLSGPKSRAVLAKGTPVDLYPDEFPIGKSAITQMAHIGVHLSRVAADTYDLSIFRGFSESFWEWLTTMAEEFGYQVV